MSKLKPDSAEKFFIAIIGIAVIALILRELNHIFIPFVLAYFLFFFFSPLNTFLANRKVPQFAIILIDLAITGFVIWLSFDFIISSFIQFGDQSPEYTDKLSKIVRQTAASLKIRDTYFTRFSIDGIIRRLDYKLIAGGVFSSTISLMGSVLFVVLFFVFVMVGHNTIYEAIRKRFITSSLRSQVKDLKKISHDNRTSEQHAEITRLTKEIEGREKQLADMFKSITSQIQRYLIAKVAVNLCAAAIVYFTLLLLGVEFPLIWALFTFLFNFIPSIGSAAALILPVLMSLIQYESTGFALIVALILAVIQTLAFNVVEPAVIGKRLNLNPMLILFSVLFWGYIWGIVGMLLSVPLTAVIKIIISNSESENMKFLHNLMSK